MEKAWLLAHGLCTSEEKWRDLRSSIKHTEMLSKTSFLSWFKCFENHTSKRRRGRHRLNSGGMLGPALAGTGSAEGEVAGLAWIVAGLFITCTGKLQQKHD